MEGVSQTMATCSASAAGPDAVVPSILTTRRSASPASAGARQPEPRAQSRRPRP